MLTKFYMIEMCKNRNHKFKSFSLNYNKILQIKIKLLGLMYKYHLLLNIVKMMVLKCFLLSNTS